MRKPNILVIGSGRRVRETILPALYCLRKDFDLHAVYSRNVTPFSLYDKWPVTTCNSLNDIDLDNVDIIFVAVTIAAVPSVLQQLTERKTNHITLFLDTPVFGSPKDWRYSSLFKFFSNVYATEDCYFLPSFRLFRNIVENGVIGRIRHVYMMHSGFKYHALASLKYLIGTKCVSRIRRRQWNTECAEIRITCPGKIGVTLLEPRDYSVGRIMITGDRGCIVDYPLESEIKQNNVVQIQYESKDGKYSGISVNGIPVEGEDLDELFFENMADDMRQHSVTNCMKIQGLLRMLYKIKDGDNTLLYEAWDSIYDNFAIAVSKKTNLFFDLQMFGTSKSVITGLIRPFGFLLPRKQTKRDAFTSER